MYDQWFARCDVERNVQRDVHAELTRRAVARGPLTFLLRGIVAIPGDADLNRISDFDDYSHIDTRFNKNLNGWSNEDFDGNYRHCAANCSPAACERQRSEQR